MPRKGARQGGGPRDVAAELFDAGYKLVAQHPLFAPLASCAWIHRREGRDNLCPANGWAVVTTNGYVHVHPTRRADPEEWAYALAHCLLHLGFGHFRRHAQPREWNAACCTFIARFLAELKLGRAPMGLHGPVELPAASEERAYEAFCERGIPAELAGLGTAGPHAGDLVFAEPSGWQRDVKWGEIFGQGLAAAVTSAVQVAAGVKPALGAVEYANSPAQRARSWFISSYPLLGALAASFRVIEDPLLCHRMGVSVAAVHAGTKEVYMNPAAGLDEMQCRFVMAHELLHVGLRHEARRQGRDPFLWNIACDYVINGWLVEMGVGHLPSMGLLHDPELKGLSAEAIYDRVVTDLRRFRRLATFRGAGVGDVLDSDGPAWWSAGDGVTLDEFYRRSLSQGLSYHYEQGRGLLPGGLEEEIRALGQPPIPWDVELAKWFDHYFPPPDKVQTYARPSRRQSSTPDIPRPRWIPAPDWEEGRTFGVLLDTSGSMDRELLAKALGTIASYSIARDVPAVRVVFCDAATYDQGYMAPEAIAQSVKVRGRGGTILQPGVDLLERAEDFPPDGPLLIITDGACDKLHVRREHAYLVPEGHHVPFVAAGPVFYIK